MKVSFFTNFFLSLLKIFAGIFGGSGALIADGFHSFSDLVTDLVAIFGSKLSLKPADEKHPYGHGKIEYITSIFIAVVILFLGLSILKESFQKQIVIPSLFVLGVSFFTVIVKFFLATFLLKEGKRKKSNLLIASGNESKTDVYSSIVVFISVFLMQLSKQIPILKYADFLAMILVGLLIIKVGFQILRENLSLILEEQETDEEYLKQIKEIILNQKEIAQIDSLRVIKFGAYYKVDAEVSMNPFLSLLKSHRHIHEVENALREFDEKILYVSIHVNPFESYELKEATKKNAKEIIQYYQSFNRKKRLTTKDFNDFYLISVQGKNRGFLWFSIKDDTMIIFDIYLEEAYRYCGIGSNVIETLKKKYPQKTISLEVLKDHSFLLHFWQKLGFQILKEKNHSYQMEFIGKEKMKAKRKSVLF